MSGSPKYDGALRDIQSPTFLHYRTPERPEALAVLTPRVAQEPEIWIDTETADWNTKSPRLSLVQLRLGDGSLHVLDVLSPEMAAAYHTTFAPRVIASRGSPSGRTTRGSSGGSSAPTSSRASSARSSSPVACRTTASRSEACGWPRSSNISVAPRSTRACSAPTGASDR